MSQSNRQWLPDHALPNSEFEATTLTYVDDYDGTVVATLVRRPAPAPTGKAALYIHGYTDYFFQVHLADAFNANGYNFYALDLRKYGRSLRKEHHPNYCRDVNEYFAEINDSIRVILEEEGNQSMVLMGHSTGGLIAALYADAGEQRHNLSGVILNSPFFDWYLPPDLRNAVRMLSIIAPLFPFFTVEPKAPSPYFLSILKDHHGEWEYNMDWRPLNGVPTYSGWCRAIDKAHARVRAGLHIQCPVLVMHSDKSFRAETWRPEYQSADTVLDVEHIRAGSKCLGKHVTRIEVEDGLHDLFLSRKDVREAAMTKMFAWLATLRLSEKQAIEP